MLSSPKWLMRLAFVMAVGTFLATLIEGGSDITLGASLNSTVRTLDLATIERADNALSRALWWNYSFLNQEPYNLVQYFLRGLTVITIALLIAEAAYLLKRLIPFAG